MSPDQLAPLDERHYAALVAQRRMLALHREIDRCRACSTVVGTPVHGPAVLGEILLVGQAPGVHEAGLGRPFAWTAGRTLFRWLEGALGLDEAAVREHVYFTAIARCFPGKASGGGDRRPDRLEIARCQPFVRREVEILQPKLILAVGTLAIGEVLGPRVAGLRLEQIIGREFRVAWHGVESDVIPLPHPSGASPWPKIEPGKTLLQEALGRVRAHPSVERLSTLRSLA